MMMFLRMGFIALAIYRLAAIGGRSHYSAPDLQRLRDGKQVFVDVQRHRKTKRVIGVRIAVKVPAGIEFLLRPEGTFDGIAKTIGLASEWQTGDRDFDGRVFIVSEERALHEALSFDARLRKSVDDLVAQREDWVLRCTKGWLEVSYPGKLAYSTETTDGKIADDFANETGPLLLELAQRIEPVVAQIGKSREDPRDKGMAVVAGLSMTLGVLGALAFVYTFITGHNYQIVFTQTNRLSLWFTSAVGAVLLGAVFLWLRGTSRSHAALLDVLLAGIPGAWVASFGFASWYNQHLDHGMARAVPVHVESAYHRKSRRSTSYYVVVREWPDPRGERKVQVARQHYQYARAGSCVIAQWHDGALHDGWISGLEPPGEHGCETGALERY
jgi:hypothetical protein